MEKTNIIICDDCKLKIAKIKCEVCKNDLCVDCLRSLRLEFGDYRFNEIYLCDGCREKINYLIRDKSFEQNKANFDEDDKIKKILLDKIRKKLILKNLKEEDGNKAEDN